MTETGSRRTTAEWLQLLGAELRQRRIRADLTQEDLAARAGISPGALKHLESGKGANLTSFIKVVRTLGAEDWLRAFISAPNSAVSPIQMLRERQHPRPVRQRVRRSRH
jgi:transcriptional regulator with XRE-family HTH domain